MLRSRFSWFRILLLLLLFLILPTVFLFATKHYGWEQTKATYDWVKLGLAIYGGWIAVVAAFWQILLKKSVIEFIILEHSSKDTCKTEEFKSIFKVLTPTDITKELANLSDSSIPYVQRLPPPEYREMIREMLDASHLLIIGRTGLGKTREAIELIKRLEVESGEEVTVLVPKGSLYVPYEIPREELKRHVVLFIDDLPKRYTLPGPVKDPNDIQMIEGSFRERFEQTLRVFSDSFGPRFRVIATGTGEPEDRRRLCLDDEFWESFSIYELPGLASTQRHELLSSLERYYGTSISPEAKDVLSQKSDGTFGGLIDPIKTERSNKQITENVVRKYDCLYPRDWEKSVYRTQFEPFLYRRNILAALSIIQQAELIPYGFLVVDLAARLSSNELLFWHKRRIRRELPKLRDWIQVTHDRLSCPDAYIRGKGDLRESKHKLLDSIRSLMRREKYLHSLRTSVFSFVDVLSFQLYDPENAAKIIKQLLKVEPDDSRTLNRLAIVNLELGDMQAAEGACLKSIDLSDHVNSWATLTRIREEQGHYTEAIKAAQIAIQKDPERAYLWARLGVVLSKLGKHKEAIEAGEKAVQLDSRNPSMYVGLSISYDKANRIQKAIEACKTAISLNDQIATVWQTLGVAYSRAGQYDEAIDACNKAVELDPASVEALSTLARSHECAGHIEIAVTIFNDAINADSENAETWLSYGIALERAGRYTDAITALKEAVRLNGSLTNARLALIMTASAAHKFDLALELALLFRDQYPDKAKSWFTLGIVYFNTERYSDALSAFHTAVELDPEMDEAWRYLSIVYTGLEKFKEAVDAAEKFRNINPTDFNACYFLGRAYSKVERYADASAALTGALRIKPESFEAWQLLGAAYTKLDRYDQAMSAAKKLVELDPENAKAWYILGCGYGKIGNRKDQIDALIEATKLDSSHLGAWKMLRFLYILHGNNELALNAARKVAEIDSDNPDAWYRLVVTARKADESEEAVASLLKTVELNPELEHNVRYWFELGTLYATTGKIADSMESIKKAINLAQNKKEVVRKVLLVYMKVALEAFQKKEYEKAVDLYKYITELDSSATDAWRLMSSSYRRLHKDEEAVEPAERVSELSPNNVDSWYVLGLRYAKVRKDDEAIDAFQAALKIDRCHSLSFRELGKLLIKLDRLSEGLQTLSKVIDCNSNDKSAWEEYGKVLVQAHRYPEAEAAFDRVAGLSTSTANSLTRLGHFYRSSLTFEKAQAAYGQALNLNNSNAEAIYGLALCMKYRGDLATAQNLLKRVMDLDPSNESARYILAQLESSV